MTWAVETRGRQRPWGTLGTFEPMPAGGEKWRLMQVWQSICGRRIASAKALKHT